MSNLSTESFTFNNDKKEFSLVLKADELPSTNQMYGYGRGGYKFLLPHVRDYKASLREQIAMADPLKHCKDWLHDNNVFHLQLQFIIKQSFFKRDLDNFNKATQDAIFEALNINDARIIELSIKKSYKEGTDEYIIINLSQSEFDWQYYNK